MPLQDWNLESTWQNAYRLKKASDPNTWAPAYERDCSVYSAAPNTAAQIASALVLLPAHKVGFIGAGYGWIANAVAQLIGCTVAAIDTSQYIQDRKLANADVEIINADVSAGSGRAQVRQALGITGNSKATYMVTENVITCLTDQECLNLSSFLHDLSDNVVHWTAVPDLDKQARGLQDLNYNWKTIAEWKALLPNDLFIVCGEAVLA